MNTVFLGKTLKAMYKLSGKTLTQLADETGLTVDTINNFFYARLQKPSFLGVSALVSATGYTVADPDGFMAHAEKLPADGRYHGGVHEVHLFCKGNSTVCIACKHLQKNCRRYSLA